MQTLNNLTQAYDGSWFTIAGAGGDLQEWEDGVNELLAEQGIGTPTAWYSTTGAAVNHFAEHGGHTVTDSDHFEDDLTLIMFPLQDLNVGALAMLKIQMGARWFDDIIDNMRRD